MRFLPRLPLYSAVAALTATCTVLLTAMPASAQVDLHEWAVGIGLEGDDLIPCSDPTGSGEPMNGTPWHVTASGLEQAHEHNTGLKADGTPVRVAVIDSGVENDHPTFDGNVKRGADPFDPDSDAQCDIAGHGTAVAGIIAGGHDDVGFMGVAPDAEIIPFRLFPTGEEGGNNQNISQLIARAIDAAVAAGADVINISIAVLASPELEAAVNDAWSDGVLVVAATGNEKKYMNDEENELPQDEETYYPANYPKTLAVGASDINGALYAEENYGDNLDLIAPGEGISVPSNSGEGYVPNVSGTSFAAPHVAGAAALLIGKYGDLATPQWITDRLTGTATHPADADGFNEYQGHGLLNIPKALTASDSDEGDEEATLPPFEPRQIEAMKVGYDPLADEKMIAWASLGAAVVLITLVLVLKKIVPSGRRRGWKPGTRRSDRLPVKTEADTS